jgi:2'-5' RNA ligase
MTFRGFIAVELKGLDSVLSIIEEIRGFRAPFKLVRPENMHITLKFLGDTPDEQIPEIVEVMQTACVGKSAFDIGYKGLGAFPNQRKMSVLWVGITGAEPMKDIARGVEDGVEPLGFKREKRPFKPHLTLGRLRRHKRLDNNAFNGIQGLFETYKDQDFGGCTIDRIVLKKSTLTPQGPIYTDLEEIVLPSEE